MADHNVEGHRVVLLRLWTSDVWRAVWVSPEVESFERLGLPYDMSDRDLWQLCQQRQMVLLTANCNDEGPDSLKATIRTGGLEALWVAYLGAHSSRRRPRPRRSSRVRVRSRPLVQSSDRP